VARSLTTASDAIWITPRHAVQLDLDNGWLAAVGVPVPPAAEPVGLLTRSAERPGELGSELVSILRELA
jgi:DNA-binding transcriptional LysR family regulator